MRVLEPLKCSSGVEKLLLLRGCSNASMCSISVKAPVSTCYAALRKNTGGTAEPSRDRYRSREPRWGRTHTESCSIRGPIRLDRNNLYEDTSRGACSAKYGFPIETKKNKKKRDRPLKLPIKEFKKKACLQLIVTNYLLYAI